MLQINKLSKTYRSNVVLKELSFEVKEHRCMGIVGKSGSGKSTLARLMLGLETPSTGEVLMENEPIVAWQKRMGYKLYIGREIVRRSAPAPGLGRKRAG